MFICSMLCILSVMDIILSSTIRNITKQAYGYASEIASLLHIACPDIVIKNKIDFWHGPFIESQLGRLITPTDDPALRRPLIVLSKKYINEPYLLEGTIAHELRHLWQYQDTPEISLNHAVGLIESLMNKNEIDADAFSIWYLNRKYSLSLEKAASIMCPAEHAKFPVVFYKRIENANSFNKKT